MGSFTCPFCGTAMSISYANHRQFVCDFDNHYSPASYSHPVLMIEFFRCANEDCKKETIIASGKRGYIENSVVNVYPRAVYRHFPEYVPEAIRRDYEEAQQVKNLSPKASATLARRCLQGMIRDFWGVNGKNLYDEINQIQTKVHPMQWDAIDAMRKMGNIGAHMEKDVNLIIDISPEEAGQLLSLIELLIDKWYVARHDEEELYKRITTANSSLQSKRQTAQLGP